MKSIFSLFVLLFVGVLLAAAAPHPACACTGFLATGGGAVLAGNNEDYNNPNTRMWVYPPGAGALGRIYFGFDDMNPQGGVNEKGLFYDGFALGILAVTSSTLKPPPFNICDRAMSTCATVAEVVKLFDGYSRPYLDRAQLFFADATGDSVIIEGNSMVRKKGAFQVVTNFRQSQPGAGRQSCDRFRIASEMLESHPQPDVALCRGILDACHQECDYPTLYSQVYDLKNRKIHLYHFHNFENEVVIDIAAELKIGRHLRILPEMFPETFVARQFMKLKNADRDKRIAARLMKTPDYASYAELTGRYAVAGGPFGGTEIVITREGNKLFGDTGDSFPTEILPQAPLTFFYLGGGLEITLSFTKNPQGKVDGFVANYMGLKVAAKKAK